MKKFFSNLFNAFLFATICITDEFINLFKREPEGKKFLIRVKEFFWGIFSIFLSVFVQIIGADKYPEEENKMLREMKKRVEAENEKLEQYITAQINGLPQNLRETLPIQEPLKFFKATNAIELLINRFARDHSISRNIVYLSENGNISFASVSKYYNAISCSTTINEMCRFTKILNDKLICNLMKWITRASVYWKDIIPNYEVIAIGMDNEGKYVMCLEHKPKGEKNDEK